MSEFTLFDDSLIIGNLMSNRADSPHSYCVKYNNDVAARVSVLSVTDRIIT